MKFKFILIFDCDGHDSDCYSPMGFYISLSDSLLSWKRKKLASKSGLLKWWSRVQSIDWHYNEDYLIATVNWWYRYWPTFVHFSILQQLECHLIAHNDVFHIFVSHSLWVISCWSTYQAIPEQLLSIFGVQALLKCIGHFPWA